CSTLSCTHTTSLAADTLSLHDALPISALGDQISKLPDDFRIENCVAIFGIKNGKWHTPASLPRDHPVRTRFDRAGDAVFTPRGNPLHFLMDRLERLVTQRIDSDKELLDVAKDDRRFRAPTVRIRVMKILY